MARKWLDSCSYLVRLPPWPFCPFRPGLAFMTRERASPCLPIRWPSVLTEIPGCAFDSQDMFLWPSWSSGGPN
jgi:hypothetical protein